MEFDIEEDEEGLALRVKEEETLLVLLSFLERFRVLLLLSFLERLLLIF